MKNLIKLKYNNENDYRGNKNIKLSPVFNKSNKQSIIN